MSIKLAKFRDVSEGTQPGQFAVGDRFTIDSIADLDPSFKKLMDHPVTQVLGIVGPGGDVACRRGHVRSAGDPSSTEIGSQEIQI